MSALLYTVESTLLFNPITKLLLYLCIYTSFEVFESTPSPKIRIFSICILRPIFTRCAVQKLYVMYVNTLWSFALRRRIMAYNRSLIATGACVDFVTALALTIRQQKLQFLSMHYSRNKYPISDI